MVLKITTMKLTFLGNQNDSISTIHSINSNAEVDIHVCNDFIIKIRNATWKSKIDFLNSNAEVLILPGRLYLGCNRLELMMEVSVSLGKVGLL